MNKKKKITILSFALCFIIVIIVISISCPGITITEGTPTVNLLDNFDVSKDTNLWGGTNSRSAAENSSFYEVTHDFTRGKDATGGAFKLWYDVNNTNAYFFCVFPLASSGVADISDYTHLTFWIKNNALTNIKFNIELVGIRDNNATSVRLHVDDYFPYELEPAYEQVSIPLCAFTEANPDLHLNKIEKFQFLIEQSAAYPKGYDLDGTIYIDDLGFY